ncbi:MAG TPA: hypothetical protein VFN71_02395 [Methylomirabilota bacterium]|nr:hypothetical protein [Methylomirabilota bacterium]
MRAIAVSRGEASRAALEGRIVCHDVRDADGRVALEKGQVLDARAVTTLLGVESWSELHLLELEPGDIHEEPAGARLSAAAAGPGVEVRGYSGGQWTLASTRRGLLRAHVEALHRVNALEGVSIFTLYDRQPVEAGETVAKAKISPLAIPEGLVKQAEEHAWAADGLVSVKGFEPRVVGALARGSLEARQRERFESSLREKVDWFGSRLLPVRYPAGDGAEVARAIQALIAEGAEILIAAGAASLDPLDPIFTGLAHLGARMERQGVPAHPGSLLWIADLRARPVLGMPACGMFSQATTFDLVLPRLLAGERVGREEVATLGHGGLLSRDSAWRFPPYRRSGARGELGE